MRETYGGQQGDAWLRNRVGRITGSRIADVCSYLTRKSGDKKAGDSSSVRDEYKLQLIAERLTGRAKDQYNSPAMQRGSQLEDKARECYAMVADEPVEKVGFVLHPKYDFTGASADSLVGDDGVLEIKCLLPWNHLKYVLLGQIPEEYVPQIAWEMACANRKWCDFVLYCPDIQGCDELRFWYRRYSRTDLVWTVGSGKDEQTLTGDAVIDYFTREVLKMQAEIEYFFAEHKAAPVAPFPVEVITEDGEVIGEGISEADLDAFMDRIEMAP